MNRREFISKSSSGMLALSLGGLLGGCNKKSGKNPNVVFIVVDDLNNWVGCMGGHPDALTPNIDRLAGRGVLFTNAHCSAPLCNPSRASLMTGIRPSTSGVYDNFQEFRSSQVLKNARTIPQHFMSNGYEAISGGKIFHRKDDRESWHSHFPSRRKNHLQDIKLRGIHDGFELGAQFMPLPLQYRDADMPDFKTVSWAIEELKNSRSRPVFLAVGLRKPHEPLNVPAEYHEKFPVERVHIPETRDNDLQDVPPLGKKLATSTMHEVIVKSGLWPKAVAAYLASVNFIDAQIGRLLDAVDSSADGENTIIVLVGDNGMHLGEKKSWGKLTPWNESTNVPLIIAAARKAGNGKRCARPASLIDLYPTLTDLCGLGPKSGLEGRSLVPLIDNPSSSWAVPALTTVDYKIHSLCTDEWRYVRYPDGAEELYDRKNDPHEWRNISGDAAHAGVKSWFMPFLPKSDAEPIERSAQFTESGSEADE